MDSSTSAIKLTNDGGSRKGKKKKKIVAGRIRKLGREKGFLGHLRLEDCIIWWTIRGQGKERKVLLLAFRAAPIRRILKIRLRHE